MDRIWNVVKSRLEKGDSYDAYQLLISRLSRFNPSDSVEFGLEKAKYFDEYGFNEIACHVCTSMIKKAREEKLKITNSQFNSIMYILSSGSFCNEKGKLLNDTLLWCKDHENDNIDYIYKLHVWASNYYFVHKNFSKAQLYVILTENPELFANILIEWSKKGYQSEKDIFLLRAVLILLSLKKTQFAHDLLDRYCQLLNENNDSSFSSPYSSNSTPDSNIPSAPIQMAFFVISACELTDKKTAMHFFDIIKNKYALLIRRDPSFTRIIDKIDQIYFNRQKNASFNMLSNLLSMFSTDEQ
ncbi:uncharacterized protein cubi_02213 [Cryptosporidium ubiquitum]|uniref:Uncharacterized protein n=1 Tax=Cryptosporidium ubiquitum TaxID=857276 RepID=A0A1J4MFG6_9CRYT|nr:uncharacterized protein cubi_02213 [Cryptosporidium ubiquitum]OII72982.1 hypothetical protein cubi_02213 [Cryptosporidium ubiquitum]